MKAALLTRLDHMEIAEAPEPVLRPGTVKIELRTCGICGSDVHLYHFGSSGKFQVSFPYVLGHECAGVITEVAPDVAGLRPGDRVAVEPGVPCGSCEYCRAGSYNLCPEVRFLAAPPVGGCLQEVIVHSADFVYKLPDALSFEEGALLEPLAVALHAGETAGVALGSDVLVFGAGCIGILCGLVARAMGARRVAICDVIQSRLDFASGLGLIPVPASAGEDALLAQARSGGFDCAIDAAGAAQTISGAIRALRPRGTLACVGLASDRVDGFDLARVLQKELTLRGVFRYRNNYPTAIAAVESGRIDVRSIVSHRYPFSEAPRAFAEAVERKSEIIKGIICY